MDVEPGFQEAGDHPPQRPTDEGAGDQHHQKERPGEEHLVGDQRRAEATDEHLPTRSDVEEPGLEGEGDREADEHQGRGGRQRVADSLDVHEATAKEVVETRKGVGPDRSHQDGTADEAENHRTDGNEERVA